jgi:DNA-binding transcriptional ArsR family regulator
LRRGRAWNQGFLALGIRLTGLLARAPASAALSFGLTYADIGIYAVRMARAATTADAFNAVAEPRRRQILDALAAGERPVNKLVEALGLAQPQVSKHLRVLREVGAVEARSDGRRRLYRLNAPALRPIHEWVKDYEELWSRRFDDLDTVLEELKKEEGDGSNGE